MLIRVIRRACVITRWRVGLSHKGAPTGFFLLGRGAGAQDGSGALHFCASGPPDANRFFLLGCGAGAQDCPGAGVAFLCKWTAIRDKRRAYHRYKVNSP